MSKENNINNNCKKEGFFQVYPPLQKVVSNTNETHKFAKLFTKPIKRIVQKNQSNNPTLNQNSSYKSLNKHNLELIEESLFESNRIFSSKNSYYFSSTQKNNSNSAETKTKQIDATSNNEYSNDDDYSYYLINKAIDLQKENKKRTHSIKKALSKFIYKSNIIEKLKTNLYTIEAQKNNVAQKKANDSNNINNANNNIDNNNKEQKKDDTKFSSKIYDIIKQIARRVIIEKLPENEFVIKMNEKGDNCYFLLSGKLSILKPVEYKNMKITQQEYITYLVNLLKYNETDLINQILQINHYIINIKSIEDFIVITKECFIKEINKYLELFNTLSFEDIETLLKTYNLKFEDFVLDKYQIRKDLSDIENNKYKNQDLNDCSDSDRKNEEKSISKNMILKGYILNKFTLTLNERIVLSNYTFLFNPREENKTFILTLFKFEYFLNLFPGSFFGDMALDSKLKKRNATIRTEEECIILSLSNEDYISLLLEDNQKLKSIDILFLTSKFFFTEISPFIFDKYYYSMFKSFDKYKGDIIYRQESELSSLYFLKEGNVKLELNASVIDIHNLIKFYIDILEEKNYVKLSNKKIEKLKFNYLSDYELMSLRTKNYIFLQQFNVKQKFEMSIIDKCECLGDLELFLVSGYIHTCSVVSQKATLIEIKKKDLCKILNQEKDVLPNYYQFVTNKLISQIKRLYHIKNNFITQIKSKVQYNYYDNNIYTNFYDKMKKNNNTNSYYDKQVQLKKLVPNVYKYIHLDPPTILDSKWKQKHFDKEKNKIYIIKQKERENNEKNNDIKNNDNKDNDILKKSNEGTNTNKREFYNIRFRKILEEASTAKSMSNSEFVSNSLNRKNNNTSILYPNIIRQYKLRRADSDFRNKIISSQTIITGKYHISLSKLEKQINNMEPYDPLKLNIVKNYDDDILKEKALLYRSPNPKNISFSSINNIFLPSIKRYKSGVRMDKKNNLKNIKQRNSFLDITRNLTNDDLKSYDCMEKEIKAISQVVKNFYMKQKNNGYTSLVNLHNNKYYKRSRKDFINFINNS